MLTPKGKFVYGISRKSELSLDAVNYMLRIQQKLRLITSLITKTEVDSEISCQFEYLEEPQCKFYNFEAEKNSKNRFRCQLSDSDRFVHLDNLSKDENFRCREIRVK